MRKYRPKSTALTIIKLLTISICLVLTAVARFYPAPTPVRILMTVLACIFWAVGIIMAFLILPAFFRRTVIYVSGAEICLHTGMIFLKREIMKMSAVQYVTKLTFPLSGFSGFNFVIVRGLGGTIILPFLRLNDANEIIDLLHAKITER